MGQRESTKVPVYDAAGVGIASLLVSLRPLPKGQQRGRPHPLRVRNKSTPRATRHVLLEDAEYRYEWKGLGHEVRTSHGEIFKPDNDTGVQGSLRPQRNTGTVAVHALVGGERVGTATFEVRSRKLRYKKEYRWMLGDLTRSFTDLVMREFAAGQHDFKPSTDDARSLYQRFSFLQAVLEDDDFDEALHRVKTEPHITWRTYTESRSPASGVRPTAAVLRQLAQGGERVPWAHGAALGLDSLPRHIDVGRTDATTDNVPNRFVRFALESFRTTVAELAEQLEGGTDTAARVRGRAEAERLITRLQQHLDSPLLRSVSPLRRFPAGDQVLQKKAGYRDVLRTYLLADVASKLTWKGGEDVYGAGKRDVAALYEYWAFLRLAQIVGSLCDLDIRLPELVEAKGDGLAIKLRSGKHQSIRATYRRADVPLELTLHFNRRFGTGETGNTSWSRPMQPDCSLEIKGPARRYDVDLGSTWLHFDAKYRIDRLSELFGKKNAKGEALKGKGGEVKRADLLKMHAYRDAIRRSVGAYVLYPGKGSPDQLPIHHEILPGLGAFPLRPKRAGKASGTGVLIRFLETVFRHLASAHTQRERARYWTARAVEHEPMDPSLPGTSPLLERPPADTTVGLGFVKSPTHQAWIEAHSLYCVRADASREGAVPLRSEFLRADFLVLYDAAGARSLWPVGERVEVLTAEELRARDYPEPGGTKYLALELGPEFEWEESGLGEGDVAAFAAGLTDAYRAPVSLGWTELQLGLSGVSYVAGQTEHQTTRD